MREDEKLVAIAEFMSSFDADLAKITLENEGIEASVMGENLSAIQPYSSRNAIKLEVFEKDVERAKQILAEKQSLDDSEGEEGSQ